MLPFHLFLYIVIILSPILSDADDSKLTIVPEADRISDVDARVALAAIDAGLGHVRASQNMFEQALKQSSNSEPVLLQYAEAMNLWGDFHRIEFIYREYLKNHPADVEVQLKLGQVLQSAQRYEEAEGIYQQLVFNGYEKQTIYLKLAELNLQKKEFQKALSWIENAEQTKNTNLLSKILCQKAEILYHLQRYKEALQAYSMAADMPDKQKQAWIGMAKVLTRINESDKSKAILQNALAVYPKDISIQFYVLDTQTATSDEFLQHLMNNADISAMDMVYWARLYAENGFQKIAVQCYETALKKDADCFPAQIELAEILAIDHQYDRSLTIFETLAKAYPEHIKIWISWARTLAWSKQFDASISVYQKIIKRDPQNPLPRKELARTALWAKQIELAMETYHSLWQIPVDQELLSEIEKSYAQQKDKTIEKIMHRLQDMIKHGSIYQGYELCLQEIAHIEPRHQKQINAMLIRYLPIYQIQKGAVLEQQAKWSAWNKRFIEALEWYESLIAFDPGNIEAIFDYGQVNCALGLCHKELDTYQRLLAIDTSHQLASMAIKNVTMKTHPSLHGNYSFWDENGHGELSQMTRHKIDLIADIPMYYQYHMRIMAHEWKENPKHSENTYRADGFSLEMNGIVNSYIQGAFTWTRKDYKNNELGLHDFGSARIGFSLLDYAKLSLGMVRAEELYNDMGIQEQIQADHFWAEAAIPISRKLDVHGHAQYINYNDVNEGEAYNLSLGYAFTDHPQIFKVTLLGEYRNTNSETLFHYEKDVLIGITHPYWTPQDYFNTEIILDWTHDISSFFFCGTNLHRYDLRLSFGTNTDHNPSVKFEGKWHYEFLTHLLMEFNGMVHRSKDWDAEALWANVRYQF
ncbi:MAG: tetratricopeptide repeat protein [Desulfobacterales bacterium]|nr:tetratricopeptide repeat protein [Desulfobacterales bacterium]